MLLPKRKEWGEAEAQASFATGIVAFKTNLMSDPRVLIIPAMKAKGKGKELAGCIFFCCPSKICQVLEVLIQNWLKNP